MKHQNESVILSRSSTRFSGKNNQSYHEIVVDSCSDGEGNVTHTLFEIADANGNFIRHSGKIFANEVQDALNAIMKAIHNGECVKVSDYEIVLANVDPVVV